MKTFTVADAYEHTSLARSQKLAQLWANVANYYATTFGSDEVTCCRKANYAVARKLRKEPKEPEDQARLRHNGQRQGFMRFGSDRGY